MTPLEKAINKASELLAKREDENEYHLHDVDRKWVIEAMMDYAEYCLKGTSSQTENKGLDWLVSHWKKLQLEGEKMNWEQIIKITELAKEIPSSQTEISDEEIERKANICLSENLIYSPNSFIMGAKWYREQLKKKQ